MTGKRIITIVVAVVVVGIIFLTLTKNKKKLDEDKKPEDRSKIAVNVLTDTVRKQPLSNTLQLPATLIAKDEGTITAETSGRIDVLHIELGTYVNKGQVVGHIDMTENKIKLSATELSISKLEQDYERNKVLLQGNATNANAVSDARYDLDSKKLDADQLRATISKANIISPVSGTIIEKKVLAGEYVTTGGSIASVFNTMILKARIYVPESRIMAIKPGQKAVITTESLPGKVFHGTVAFISPKGDDNHNFTVELVVDNTNGHLLKAGLYVKATLMENEIVNALQIPKVALVEGVKNPYVYTIVNNRAVAVKIMVGRENNDMIEVLSGLSEGQVVITSGLINVVSGNNVHAINKSK
ncbi:efflux RND transporter periplasmic adaptor subunit [Chitinophaga sancti]|uniref:efflux RND transporter periplasmic adaptor subunit n=1 Tax=Chitinophaga sancti TaxID=1004 RepID=UPI002A74D2FE|nr:efflux RND transporter periplasmic adaptor subunit [Chitinophaga sancti]WPQ61415.1 efflux RND transporter periplasmic adaptor subunit [Chitinophaga sancti]